MDRDGHDARPAGRGEEGDGRRRRAGPRGHATRSGGSDRLPRLGALLLHHRGSAARERRPLHVSNSRRESTARQLGQKRREDAPEPGAEPWHRSRTMLYALFAASGFAGLIYESIWTHYLKLFLGHAAYAQTLVLAIFMGGLALGSWISSRKSPRWRNLFAAYAITEAVVRVLGLVFHEIFTAT